MIELSEIVGKTITSISGMRESSEEIIFKFSDGTFAKFYHEQDCCEHVEVDDICGDVEDLIGSPIITAREAESSCETEYGSETATFYEFATNKGSVTVRWIGRSNGYYSERVDIEYGVVQS